MITAQMLIDQIEQFAPKTLAEAWQIHQCLLARNLRE